jgi:hypothetical protein
MRKRALILAIFVAWALKAEEYPSVKVGGFIASQFVNDESENIGVSNQWKFRHARLHGIGQTSNKLNWFIQIETATGNVVLQNAFANLTYLPNTEIRAGYIKIPFGIEAYGHPLQNPTIDISQASKKIYRGAQDIGMHVKCGYRFVTCWVAVVNGNNGATCDNNSCKDLCGRLLLTPVKGVDVGGSYYAGKRDTLELATNRLGVEFNYKHGPAQARVEYLGAKDEQVMGDKESIGYYAVLAYRFIPQIEGVVRYDVYDLDTKVGDNEWSNLTLGLSYYFVPSGWNRISLNYEIRNDKTNELLGNLLTLQLQILF